MKFYIYHKLKKLLVFVFIALAMTQSITANAIEKPEWVDGEVLIKFKDTVDKSAIKSFLSSNNLKSLHKYRLINAQHLKLPENLTVREAIKKLSVHPLVDSIEPNYLHYISSTPDDTLFDSLWGANNTGQTGGTFDADMDLPEAWDITTGDAGLVVAVIDSGAELTHPDLAGNIWVNPGEIAGNGIDDDGNGYIDDINGWDFVRNDNDPSPVGGACSGHGTHTAGTIGAIGNNGTGITGVAWNVKIMPLNTFRTFLLIFCTTADADLLEAIDYYANLGVRISSNSYGGGGASSLMEDAIRSSKSIFVAAAGNEGRNNDNVPSYPANYDLDNIISVAATDHNDQLASFSNFGATVDVAAPGVDIVSTVPGGYESFDGTSMAAPNVAGVAALLLSQDSNLTNQEVVWRIKNGTEFKSLPVATQGRVNAFNSLQYGLSLPDVSVDIGTVGSATVAPGGTVTYFVNLTNNTASDQDVSGSVYASTEQGETLTLIGPADFVVAAGDTLNFELTQDVPAALPAQDIELFAAVETSNSFDEDVTIITVTP